MTYLPSLELTPAIPSGLPFGFAGYFSVGSRVRLSTYLNATLPLATNCCGDDGALKLARPSRWATAIGNALFCIPCKNTLGAVSESVILTMHTLASYCSETFVSNVGQPSVPGMMLWRRERNWHPLQTPRVKVSLRSKNVRNSSRTLGLSRTVEAQPRPAPRTSPVKFQCVFLGVCVKL